MPTVEQTTQIAQAALQTPINNLIVLLALIALLIMALGGVLVWRFAPSFVNLYKQQAETNEKLTAIVGQNSDQNKLAIQSVDHNTLEMKTQTAAIVTQTTVIESLGRDTRSYQALVSDNLSAHTEQIAANTAKIDTLQESQAALRKSIDDLTAQITKMLTDDKDCISVTEELKAFEERIITRLQQPTQAVSTHVVTVDVAPVENKAAA